MTLFLFSSTTIPLAASTCPDHKVSVLSYSPYIFNDFCVDYTVEMTMKPCIEYMNDVYNIRFTVPKQNFEVTDYTGFTLDNSDPTHYVLSQDVIPGASPPTYKIKVRLKEPGFNDLPNGWAITAFAKHNSGTNYHAHLSKNFAQVYKVIDGTTTPAYLSDNIYPNGAELIEPSNACIFDQQVIVKGTLIIDEDYCFATSSSYEGRIIMMEDDASIEIINGSEFTLRGAQVWSCDEMWEGIIVEDGSIVTDYGYQAPTKRAMIADAFRGVTLLDGTSANLEGLHITNSRYGIYGGGGSGLSQISLNLNDVIINGNGSLKTYNGGLGPFNNDPWDWPMSGIELVDVVAFINSCNEAPSTSTSTCATIINNCYRGVTLKNTSASMSGFYIHNLKSFSNDQPGVFNTGIWAVADNSANIHYEGYGKDGHPSFEKVSTGIKLDNVNASISDIRMKAIGGIGIDLRNSIFKNLRLIENNIETRQYGIISAWNNMVGIEFEDNKIEYLSHQDDPQIGIAMVQNVPKLIGEPGIFGIRVMNNFVDLPRARAGIYALKNDDLVIAENTVMGGNRANEYGIRVSGGSGVAVDCNLLERPSGSVTDPSAGIYIQMMDKGAIRCNDITAYPRGIEYFGTSSGSLMEGNLLEDHKIGLLYDHEASTGFHGFSGNRWLSQYGDYDPTGESGAINTGPEMLIEGSLYEVNESADPSFGTSVWSNNIPWFFDHVGTNKVCGNQLITCEDGPGANLIEPRTLDSLAWWIAVDSFVSSNYGDGAIWTARRQLYRRLAASPEWVTTGSVWESFMNTHATASVGVYESIRQGWMVMPTGTDTLQSELSLATALQDSLIGSLSQIIETISETTDTSLLQTLIAQQAQIESAIHANELELDSLYVDLVDLRNTHLLSLSTANAAASTSEDWTQAQQQANALMFKAAMQGIGVLDSTDKAQLELIADECPMILGEAVFQARGLLTSLDPGRNWDDASNCLMAQPRFQESVVSKSATLNVWPNPAQSHIYIQLGGEPTLDWDVTLFDAYGQSVVSLHLNSGLQGIEITDLVPGFYVLVASNSKGEQLNSRVLITR